MAFHLPALRNSLSLSSSRPLFRTTGFTISYLTTTRAMASATPARKYDFLIVVPDFPNVVEKRLEVRPQHFAELKTQVESKGYKMGGALLSEVPQDDEPSSLKFVGSTLIAVATSKEEVIETLKNDIYAKSGVWDVDNAQIWPLKAAFIGKP